MRSSPACGRSSGRRRNFPNARDRGHAARRKPGHRRHSDQALYAGPIAGDPARGTWGATERIDPGLLRHVARTEFKLIAPMIDALRRGDVRALQRYDDLTPLATTVERSLHDATVRLGGASAANIPAAAPASPATGKDEVPLLPMLESLGIAGDIATVLIAEARAEYPEAGTLDQVAAICDRLRRRGLDPAPKNVADAAHQPRPSHRPTPRSTLCLQGATGCL